MSAFKAQFDCSGGDAYAIKSVPASTAFTITPVLAIPAASYAALVGAASASADMLVVGDPSGAEDGLYSHPVVPDFWVDGQPYLGPGAFGPQPAVQFVPVLHLVHDIGNDWFATWTVDGNPLVGPYTTTLPNDDTQSLQINAAGIFAAAIPGEMYELFSIEVRDAASAIVFSDDFADGTFDAWDSIVGAASIVPNTTPPVPPATLPYSSPRWRFVVLDLKTFEILSFLDRIATDRMVTYTLNQPLVTVGKVPSDNPEINIPWPDPDSDPFLTEGSRALLGFRDEGPTNLPWVIRASTIIQQLSDAAGSDDAFSTYTGWDPWKYLFSRPVCNADGSLVGPDGLSFTATRVDVIAATLLRNTIINQGITGIDAGDGSTGAPPAYQDWGGTSFYTGTIDADTLIDINFPQGTTVGAAWQMLANLDVCDIVLQPIYDPINRPGYLVEFNIKTQWGEDRDDQIFAWDMPSKSLVAINRLLDGTQRGNEIKFFAGQGGSAPGGQTIPVQEDADSVTKFGEYWLQRFFPGQNVPAAVESLAAAQLELVKDGQITVTFSPAPERSPHPLTDYFLGDRVPVYASNRFRAPIPATGVPSSSQVHYQRIYGIPLTIADDATEEVQEMLTAIPTGS